MLATPALRAYFPWQNALVDCSGRGAENTHSSAVYTFGAGHAGNGVRFSGASDNYLSIQGPAASPVLPATGPITVSMWVYKAAGDGSKEYIASTAGGTSDKGYRLYFTDDARVRLIYYNGSSSVGDLSLAVDSMSWLHIAFTWSGISGDTLRLYVNGKLADSSVVNWTRDDDDTHYIARRRGYSEYGDVRMQHMCIYAAELTPAEIIRNYCVMHAVQH